MRPSILLRHSWVSSVLVLTALCWLGFASSGTSRQQGQGSLLLTNGAGCARPWQHSIDLSPNLEINLATGNLNLRVATSRFDLRPGLTPRQELVLFHNGRAATKGGNYTGGLSLGGGWSTSVGCRLDAMPQNIKRLTDGDGGEVYFELAGGIWKTLGGARVTLEEDGAEWIVTSHDQWQQVFDGSGRLIETRDASGNANVVTWNAAGKVERATEPSGRYTEFVYAASGLLEEVHGSTHGGLSGGSWTFERDANGRLFEIVDPFSGSVHFTYDASSRIQSFTDYDGKTWQFTYWTNPNKLGRVNTVTRPDGETMTLNYVFSTNEVRTDLTDVRGNLWQVVHDRKETPALVSIRDPLAKTWSYVHDVARRLKEIESPLGHTWVYTYDGGFDPLTVTDPDGIVATHTYDELNNRTSTTVDGDTTEYLYEDGEHPTRVTSIVEPPDDSTQTATTTYEYFGPDDGTPAGLWNGLLARMVDPRGCETRFTYDEHGSANGVQEGPVGATGGIDYRWNQPSGIEYVDLGGMNYLGSFPARPPLPAQIQGRLSYGGSATFEWWGDFDTTDFSFEVPIDSGSGFEYSDVSHDYDYDEFGRAIEFVVTTDEPRAHTSNPTSLTRSFAQTFDDTSATAPVELTSPDGDEVVFPRRADGAVTSAESNGGGAGEIHLEVAYTNDGHVQTITRGDGTSSHYTYTPSGRIDTIDHKSGAVSQLLLDYAYDARGLPTGLTETSPTGTVVKTWEHDSRGRLTKEIRAPSGQAAQEERYTYDAVGNRKTHTTHVGGLLTATNTYFYDLAAPALYASKNNRLMRVERMVPGAGLVSTAYFFYENPFGNVSRVVRRATGSTHYDSTALVYAEDGAPWLAWDESWDNFGSGPVNVVRGNVLETRQLGGVKRVWRLRDGNTLAPLAGAEWVADAAGARDVFGVDAAGAVTPLALEIAGENRLTGTGPQHELADIVGSSRLTSANGTLSGQDYTAFGVRLQSGGSVPTFGFAGAFGVRQAFQGAALTSSNLVAMGHRWYSPEFGRFLMRDPIGIRGGTNVYAFVLSQPTNRVDPSGLQSTVECPHCGLQVEPDLIAYPPLVVGRGLPAPVVPPMPIPPDPYGGDEPSIPTPPTGVVQPPEKLYGPPAPVKKKYTRAPPLPWELGQPSLPDPTVIPPDPYP